VLLGLRLSRQLTQAQDSVAEAETRTIEPALT
jgi:hypothetical protein